MTGRRERKKDEARRHIVEKAMELIFKNGFDQTTMEQIADAADIAKGTLYNYFPVKEAVVAAYINNRAYDSEQDMELLLEQKIPLIDALSILFGSVAEWRVEDRYILKKYITYRLSNAGQKHDESERSGMDMHLKKVLEYGVQNRLIRNDIATETIIKYLKSAYLTILLSWLDDENVILEDEIGKMIDLFLNGASNG